MSSRLLFAVRVGVVVVLVVGAVVMMMFESSSSKVHFVNGLDESVAIAVDEQPSFTLPSNERAERELTKGSHRVRVQFVAGGFVEQEQIVVPGGRDVAVYNVAGAATVEKLTVHYKRAGEDPSIFDPKPASMLISGPRYQVIRDALAFEELPDEVRGSKLRSTVAKSLVQWGARSPSWRSTIKRLVKEQRRPEAIEIAVRVARLRPTSEANIENVKTALQDADIDPAQLANELNALKSR